MGIRKGDTPEAVFSSFSSVRILIASNVGAPRKLSTDGFAYVSLLWSPRYPYFARLTSSTLALPVPTEEGISDDLEGVKTQFLRVHVRGGEFQTAHFSETKRVGQNGV